MAARKRILKLFKRREHLGLFYARLTAKAALLIDSVMHFLLFVAFVVSNLYCNKVLPFNGCL